MMERYPEKTFFRVLQVEALPDQVSFCDTKLSFIFKAIEKIVSIKAV